MPDVPAVAGDAPRGDERPAVVVAHGLAVLLVLTFFSNTIMNRTLPEVATQSVTSGSITARVRGVTA